VVSPVTDASSTEQNWYLHHKLQRKCPGPEVEIQHSHSADKAIGLTEWTEINVRLDTMVR
jgi:hypothetical protein